MPETKRADREQTKQVKAQTSLKKKDGNDSKKKKASKKMSNDQDSQSQKRSTEKSSTSKEKKKKSSLSIGGFFSARNKKNVADAIFEEKEDSKKFAVAITPALEDNSLLFETPAPLGEEIAVTDGISDVNYTNSMLTWSIADETQFLRIQAKRNYG
jgi:hypothetical protein